MTRPELERAGAGARAVWAALAAPARCDRGLERWVVRVLLGATVLFTAWFARAEVLVDAPGPSDRALHVTLTHHTLLAWHAGADPTDHWVPEIGGGFPVFHHYSPGPHLLTALAYAACGGQVTPSRLIGIATWCCLLAFPFACYTSARRLGLGRLAAGCTAFCAPLPVVWNTLGTEYGGLESGTVVAGGYGMFGQAFGMVLLPLAIADGVRACRTGRRLWRAALWCGLLVIMHMLSAYIAAVSVAVAMLVLRGPWSTRVRRLAAVGAAAAVLAAWFLVPFWLDRGAFNVSPHVPAAKRDAFGHLHVLGQLFTGGLFDGKRLPVLTLLVALGTAIAVARRRERGMRVALVLGGCWLVLYFGRPTWGPLYALLPFSRHLHLHRFVIGVHLAGLWLAGVGGAALLRCALAPAPLWGRVAACAGCALLPLPAHVERAESLEWAGRWQRETRTEWKRQKPQFLSALAAVRASPAGRLYAGLGDNWGRNYTIGHTPAYALIPPAGFDTVGYLYHEFARTGDVMVHFNEADRGWYELFNVRHVLLPAGRDVPPFYVLRKQFGVHALYGVRTGGYFALVDAPLTLLGTQGEWYGAMRALVGSPMLAAGQYPRVEFAANAEGEILPLHGLSAAELAVRPVAAGPRGAVLGEAVTAGGYTARVQVQRPCWLLLRVNYHPGWRCTVDGRPVTPQRLAPSFVGVPVAPGAQEVRFEYRAPVYRWPLLVLGWAALAGFWWWERRRARAA